MANPERAIEKLYEDAAVRDSLADAEAQMLLRWGEDQIMRLADAAPDDAAFETRIDELRGLLKGANRFVGERGQLDADIRRARLNELMAKGEALGAPPAAEASALADSFASGDDAAALQALLGLLTPASANAAAELPSTPASADVAPGPDTTTAQTANVQPPADEAEADAPAKRSVLQAFQKWLTPAKPGAPEPAPDPPATTSPEPPLLAPTTDDDTTGDSLLHGETQDDRFE